MPIITNLNLYSAVIIPEDGNGQGAFLLKIRKAVDNCILDKGLQGEFNDFILEQCFIKPLFNMEEIIKPKLHDINIIFALFQFLLQCYRIRTLQVITEHSG